jgi:hypothetical protein
MMSPLRTESLRTILSGAAMAILLTVCADASAGLVAFQNKAAFTAAIAGWSATTTDFESDPAGTMYAPGTGPAGSGFTLLLSGPDAPGMTPTIGNQFWTTSGLNYLGLDNPDSALEAGDSLTFTFGSGVHAFGLYVVGTQDIGAGDITLTTGADMVANNGVANLTDGAGSFAFFLGFVSDDATTFGSVTLNNLTLLDPRLLNITVDDVTLARNDGGNQVPEPATLLLFLMGMLACGAVARRHSN